MNQVLKLNLNSRWNQLILNQGISVEVGNKWWEIIETKYSEKQRYYHTLEHINQLFNTYDDLNRNTAFSDTTTTTIIHNKSIVELSIWFHDLVYDPTRNDNEDKSRDLFLDFSKESIAAAASSSNNQLQQQHIDTIDRFIMATKSHLDKIIDNDNDTVETSTKSTTNLRPSMITSDLKYFLDMDLSILGASVEEYHRYRSNIRNEYIHIDNENYRLGRSKVIQKFLIHANNNTLFKTLPFSKKYNQNAIINLNDELNFLSQK
eukprot:gene9907-12150_t